MRSVAVMSDLVAFGGYWARRTYNAIFEEVTRDAESLTQLLSSEHHGQTRHPETAGSQGPQPAIRVTRVKSSRVVAWEHVETLDCTAVEAGAAEPCSHLVEGQSRPLIFADCCTYTVAAVAAADTIAQVVLPVSLSRHGSGVCLYCLYRFAVGGEVLNKMNNSPDQAGLDTCLMSG